MLAPPERPTPHFILGAARSGKSTYAESLAELLPPPRVYIATAQALDYEMRLRIDNHQKRRGPSWETIEEPLELPRILRELRTRGQPVLVDCLTLWLTNLLISPHAPHAESAVAELSDAVREADHPLLIVSNEVGAGIVPDNALARRFRDLAGWANQEVAEVSRSVTLVVAGLPLALK